MKKIEKKKKKFSLNFGLRLLIMMVIMGIVGLCFIPLLKDTNYGLDLKGGFEVLYEISPIDNGKLTDDMVTATYKTLTRRIDSLGVSEPEISIEGGNRIRVKLAGVTDEDTARTMLGKTATLTFRDSNDELLMTSDVLAANGASYAFDNGKYVVTLKVADKDKFYKKTYQVSKQSINKIVIWLDYDEKTDSFSNEESNCGSENSNCLFAGTVSQGFASDVQMEGSFTKDHVKTLSDLINSGSLPTKLTELSSKTVNASFGKDSLTETAIAGVVGIILILIIMASIYAFSGLIAWLGLVIYTFLVFLIFWVFGGVLTLPGIASLLLGIGMAVDANVLSFERIKEELWKGNSLKYAFNEGYKNSLSSIIDSNVTTLIVAIVLFIFGESSVKGFATMLIISIVVTVIVMVFVVKKILEFFIKNKFFDNKLRLFINLSKKDIYNEKTNPVKKESRFKKVDFLKYRKLFFGISLTIFIVGTIMTFAYGLNLSVDFKGGTDFTITTIENLSEKDMKNDFGKLGYEKIEVETISDNDIYVRMSDTLDKDNINKVTTYFKDKYKANVENGTVSTIVKQELIKNAILSLVLAIIGIIIYVSFRFTFHFAISAIIALLHDAFFVIAMFSIFRLEVNTIFIAAILTIIGYSINDTVVIFDRIREERKLNPKKDVYSLINESLGTTMTRSLYTGLAAITTVICLLVMGSHEIYTFNIAMLLGMITGCYSSICIASPLWYEMVKNKKVKTEKAKKVYKDKYEELSIKGINS
jgi:SecD/SecF fusion protein